MLPLDKGLTDSLVIKPEDTGVSPDLVDKGLEQDSLGIVLHFHSSKCWAHPCSALDRGRRRREGGSEAEVPEARRQSSSPAVCKASRGAPNWAPTQPRTALSRRRTAGALGTRPEQIAALRPAHRASTNGSRRWAGPTAPVRPRLRSAGDGRAIPARSAPAPQPSLLHRRARGHGAEPRACLHVKF